MPYYVKVMLMANSYSQTELTLYRFLDLAAIITPPLSQSFSFTVSLTDGLKYIPLYRTVCCMRYIFCRVLGLDDIAPIGTYIHEPNRWNASWLARSNSAPHSVTHSVRGVNDLNFNENWLIYDKHMKHCKYFIITSQLRGLSWAVLSPDIFSSPQNTLVQ